MRKSILFVSLVSILIGVLAVGAASAYTLEDVVVESWSGSGGNTALLVVDFWAGNGVSDSFAFGCSFGDDSLTGMQMLDILHAADNGLTYAQSGGFVSDIWYDTGAQVYHTTYSWPDSWWGYCTSDDWGENWTPSMVGLGDRVLGDGECDGWVGADSSNWTPIPTTPVVPEPASILCVLPGLAALMGLAKRRQ